MAITLDGVNLENASAPILFQTCRFPIMDLRRYRQPDEVVQNMPTFIGAWADGTIAPALTTQVMNVDTVTNAADACRFPILSVALTSCSWLAPSQKFMSLESQEINWSQLVTEYCTLANIGPANRIGQIFNADGTLNYGNPYTLSLVRFVANALAEALGITLTHSAILGDYSSTNQFDGLYTQVDYGWADGGVACDTSLNTGNVLNWDLLTGGTGTGTAAPDAVTTAQTITLWGTSFSIPAGWTLGDLLAFYMEAGQANYGHGNAIDWEMHVPSGWRLSVLKGLTFLQLLDITFNSLTDAQKQAYADFVTGRMANLYGYPQTFPVLETYYVPDGTLRVGPRNIGGLPSYGLVMKNIVQVLQELSPIGMGLYGSGNGMIPGNAEPLIGMTRAKVNNRFEASTLHWDFMKVSPICVRASMMMEAGLLATDRHLWLKITNVGVTTLRIAPPSDFTVDSVAMDNQPPAAPTLSLPADASSAATTTPTYDWSDVTGALDYDLQVSTSDADAYGNFVAADIVVDVTVTPSTYTVPTALASNTYYWHVRTRDVDGKGAWSGTFSHTIT